MLIQSEPNWRIFFSDFYFYSPTPLSFAYEWLTERTQHTHTQSTHSQRRNSNCQRHASSVHLAGILIQQSSAHMLCILYSVGAAMCQCNTNCEFNKWTDERNSKAHLAGILEIEVISLTLSRARVRCSLFSYFHFIRINRSEPGSICWTPSSLLLVSAHRASANAKSGTRFTAKAIFTPI